METPETRATTVAGWLAWGLLPLTALMGLFQLQNSPDGERGLVPAFLFILTALCLVGAAFLPWLRHRSTKELAVVAGAFAVLVVYAAATVPFHVPTVTIEATTYESYDVPRMWLVIPLAQSGLTMVAGILLALAVKRSQVPAFIVGLATTLVAVSAVGQYRALHDSNPSNRLDTGIGGAAVFHVVVLLVLAGLIGIAWQRRLRVVAVVLALAMCTITALTGSRAGLGILVLFLVGLGVRFVAARARRPVLALVVFVVAAAVVAVFVYAVLVSVLGPEGHRLLTLSDEFRGVNAETGLKAWTTSWATVLFGNGYGVVWPWWAIEGGHVPVFYQGYVLTEWGNALVSPHSVYLGVLAELGLVGMVPLAVIVVVILRAALVVRPDEPLRLALLTALALTLAAFVVDQYLFKNFPVSLFWWFFLGLALRKDVGRRPTTLMAEERGPA